MEPKAAKLRRWRIKFSLRTILLLLTLVCCYLGFWSVTKHFGPEAVKKYSVPKKIRLVLEQSSPAPFIVAADEARRPEPSTSPAFDPESRLFYRRYYIWLFGYVVETPFKYALDLAYISSAT
jgi:hypothetical protein